MYKGIGIEFCWIPSHSKSKQSQFQCQFWGAWCVTSCRQWFPSCKPKLGVWWRNPGWTVQVDVTTFHLFGVRIVLLTNQCMSSLRRLSTPEMYFVFCTSFLFEVFLVWGCQFKFFLKEKTMLFSHWVLFCKSLEEVCMHFTYRKLLNQHQLSQCLDHDCYVFCASLFSTDFFKGALYTLLKCNVKALKLFLLFPFYTLRPNYYCNVIQMFPNVSIYIFLPSYIYMCRYKVLHWHEYTCYYSHCLDCQLLAMAFGAQGWQTNQCKFIVQYWLTAQQNGSAFCASSGGRGYSYVPTVSTAWSSLIYWFLLA